MNIDEQEKLITKIMDSIRETLLEKNRRYGNSVGNPLNVFSPLTPIQGIKQRLDDKIKRIQTSTLNKQEPSKNDVFDLIGYLSLYCVEMRWDNYNDLID